MKFFNSHIKLACYYLLIYHYYKRIIMQLSSIIVPLFQREKENGTASNFFANITAGQTVSAIWQNAVRRISSYVKMVKNV